MELINSFNLIAQPLVLTLKLASITTLILILFGTPIAFWLAHCKSRIKPILESIIALPLVLPPTVLGFYLLILLGNNGFIGESWFSLTGDTLAFSFTGLVIASTIYSLPFVIQPLQNAFESIGIKPLEAAWTLGASPIKAFFKIAIPQAKRGFITAAVLGFTHTIGEFGVVLMVGGNIPGETKVISIAIYDHVETLEYAQAHSLSLLLLSFSFIVLFLVYSFNRKQMVRL